MADKDKKSFRYIGEVPDSLANGQPIEPGEYVKLSADDVNDVYNADIIQRGLMIEVDDKLVTQAARAETLEEAK